MVRGVKTPYQYPQIAVLDVLNRAKEPLNAYDIGRLSRTSWSGACPAPGITDEAPRLQRVLPRLRTLGFITRLAEKRLSASGQPAWVYEITQSGRQWLEGTLEHWDTIRPYFLGWTWTPRRLNRTEDSR